MRILFLIIVSNLTLVELVNCQIQQIRIEEKVSFKKYTVVIEIYNKGAELIYSEKSYEIPDKDGYIIKRFNWGKVDLDDLYQASSFRILLEDSDGKTLNKKVEDATSYIYQAIIDKVESNRILRIENQLITQDILDKLSFWYNGEIVTVGVVKYKGRYWMDRNLGAKRVATSLNDTLSFGDLFQWGREADGHQLRDNQMFTDKVAIVGKQPNHNEYIIPAEGIDWNIEGSKNIVWYNGSIVKEAVNVCPDGWHVPTADEWQLALGSWQNKKDAYESILKLPASNMRPSRSEYKEGKYFKDFMTSKYWSSTRNNYNGYIYIANLSRDWVKMMCNFPSDAGLSVRCIKDK